MIYSNTGFRDLEEMVNQTCEALKPYLKRFDSIVVRGISGQSVGFPVALRLNKPIVVVRKPSEPSHSGARILAGGLDLGNRCLFLDDFVATGATFMAVAEAVEAVGSRIVGQYLYEDHSGVKWSRKKWSGKKGKE